jgi:hypothetical protein
MGLLIENFRCVGLDGRSRYVGVAVGWLAIRVSDRLAGAGANIPDVAVGMTHCDSEKSLSKYQGASAHCSYACVTEQSWCFYSVRILSIAVFCMSLKR